MSFSFYNFVATEHVRRSVKPCRCGLCEGQILPGERYVWIRGGEDRLRPEPRHAYCWDGARDSVASAESRRWADERAEIERTLARQPGLVAEWNARHTIGTAVLFFPVRGEFNFEASATRSLAWLMQSGFAMVMIEGRAGGVCLDHIQLAPAERKAA